MTLFLLTVNCNAQTKNTTDNNKTKTIEKFDITFFNKLEKDDNYTSSDEDMFYKFQDKRYRIILHKEIQVEETDINSPNLNYKVYFKKSGQLKAEGNSFYSFPIGISKEFDEKGYLIKEIDYNKDYKFSIKDLQKKMKETYNVDIMNTKETRSVSRTNIDPRIKFPYYQVVVNTGKASSNNYLLNGNTGEIFYKIEIFRGDEKDAVNEYIKTLKK